jgi:hypothetical protein
MVGPSTMLIKLNTPVISFFGQLMVQQCERIGDKSTMAKESTLRLRMNTQISNNGGLITLPTLITLTSAPLARHMNSAPSWSKSSPSYRARSKG